MSTVGFIGSGNMAAVLAKRAIAGGHQVVVSNTRGPASLAQLSTWLGPLARAGTVQESADAADWVVLAIPFGSFDLLSRDLADGKLLIDITNYYPGTTTAHPELDRRESTSSQLIQRHFEKARLVKAFNTIPASHIRSLARPSGSAERTAIPIASDQTENLDEAAALIDTFGFDVLRIGRLAQAWRFEPGSPAFITPYIANPNVPFTQDAGRPAPADSLSNFIDAAQK